MSVIYQFQFFLFGTILIIIHIQPSTVTSKARFEDDNDIRGYVPQVEVVGYPFPLLLCDVDNIDQELIGWSTPHGSYDQDNVIFDIPHVAALKNKVRRLDANDDFVSDHFDDDVVKVDDSPIFSIVKDWNPSFA